MTVVAMWKSRDGGEPILLSTVQRLSCYLLRIMGWTFS